MYLYWMVVNASSCTCETSGGVPGAIFDGKPLGWSGLLKTEVVFLLLFEIAPGHPKLGVCIGSCYALLFFTSLSVHMYHLPVVPRKAVVEVSEIGNYWLL